jgi:ketosteroid isomerase-like protein
MTSPNHALARAFFAALSSGAMPDDLLTPDMKAWTTSSGAWSDKARYQGGIRLLASIFDGGLAYSVESLTAEEDRVAAEVTAQGTLVNGEAFANRYVFILRLHDGRIASVAEHFNPIPVREKLGPLLQQAMSQAAVPGG